jgi:hypothetical protein
MRIPSREQAEAMINAARTLNPGPWLEHSLFVGRAAEAIARQYAGLDPESAFVLGCLHDIGRRAGVTDMRHSLDGYHFLKTQGFDEAARICMTHSFPVQDIQAVAGVWDCTDQELEFAKAYISGLEFNDYDRLIQLCDALALPSGFCLIEKRLLDVVLRRGVNEYSLPRWKAFLGIQQDFEKAICGSIYSLLPGVVENTFGFDPRLE